MLYFVLYSRCCIYINQPSSVLSCVYTYVHMPFVPVLTAVLVAFRSLGKFRDVSDSFCFELELRRLVSEHKLRVQQPWLTPAHDLCK